jgi:hypothetical protein
MNLKMVLIQNVFLVIGVAAVFEFFSIERLYSMFKNRENGFRLLDGDHIALDFLGVSLNDEGIHWTHAMNAGYLFLIVGIFLIIVSVGILLRIKKEITK